MGLNGIGFGRRVLRALMQVSLLAALLVVGAGPFAALRAEPFRFTILYAHSTTELDEVPSPSGGGRGGIARLAALVKLERAERGTVLVLHGGQSLAPSVLSFYDRGAHIIDLLNGIGVDAMAALNREFHHGDDIVMARAYEAAFPVITTNAVDRSTGKPLDGLEESVVLNAGPYRVGVLAAAPLRTGETTRSPRTMFRDPARAVADTAKALRAQGVDLIVAMTTTTGDTARDVIATGAADIVLYQDRNRIVGIDYPGKTLTATVDAQAAWVLALDLTIDRVGKEGARRLVWSGGVRAIDTATIIPDSEVDSRAKAYRARLDSMLGMQVGRLETPIDTRRESVRTAENAFGNAMADALRAAMDADVAIINGGSIRGDRQYPAGTVWTRRDIQTEYPYHDTGVLLEVTGQQLRDALEFGYSAIEQVQGRFPHIANARAVVDMTKPAGHRLAELTISGKPVDPAARYRLAVGSFLANGGDGYAVLVGAPRLVDDRDADFLSTILADSIARTGTFAPRLDGRITIKR